MLLELTTQQFIDELASERAVPGGGSASALVGALAGALVQMVANLTNRAGNREDMAELATKADHLTQELNKLVQADSDAYQQVMLAFKLPKTTPEQKKKRLQSIKDATKIATEVPLRTMEVCLQVMELARTAAKLGNKNAISDACVAGLLGWAATQGAAYNVKINLPGIKDEDFADQIQKKMEEILHTADKLKQAVECCLT